MKNIPIIQQISSYIQRFSSYIQQNDIPVIKNVLLSIMVRQNFEKTEKILLEELKNKSKNFETIIQKKGES